MPFYPAADHDVQPVPGPAAVACRCCPGGISRGTRPRRYPSDMGEAEWAVCEPLLVGADYSTMLVRQHAGTRGGRRRAGSVCRPQGVRAAQDR